MSPQYVEVGFSLDRVRATTPCCWSNMGPGFHARARKVQRRGANSAYAVSSSLVRLVHVVPSKGSERLELDANLPSLVFGHNARLLRPNDFGNAISRLEEEVGRLAGTVISTSDMKLTQIEVARDIRVADSVQFRQAIFEYADKVSIRSHAGGVSTYRQRDSTYLRIGGPSAAVAVYDKFGEVKRNHASRLQADRDLGSDLAGVFRVEVRLTLGRCSARLGPLRSFSYVLNNMSALREVHEDRSRSLLRDLFSCEKADDQILQCALRARKMRRPESYHFMIAIRELGFDKAIEGMGLTTRDISRKRRELKEIGFDH